MTTRDELTILQKAVQKSLSNGFAAEPDTTILGVDITLDPPAVVVRRQSRHHLSDTNLYLDSLFPLFDKEWALAFWGNALVGHATWAVMPQWKLCQHRLLEFLQNGEKEEFYAYIEIFL